MRNLKLRKLILFEADLFNAKDDYLKNLSLKDGVIGGCNGIISNADAKDGRLLQSPLRLWLCQLFLYLFFCYIRCKCCSSKRLGHLYTENAFP